MNRIKKLLGICEHDFIPSHLIHVVDWIDDNVYYSMHYKITLVCCKCGKAVKEKSHYFTLTEIANDFDDLKRQDTWNSLESCYTALNKSKNGVLVRDLFYKKLNKKYNLNLTIDDL